MFAPKERYRWDVSQEMYHLDYNRDSHSSLELFRESVLRYAAQRVHKTLPPRLPTKEMVLGSAFHCLLLEPQHFAARYAVMPAGLDGRNTAYKEAKKAAEASGRVALSDDDVRRLRAMAQAVTDHNPVSRGLIDTVMSGRAIIEQAIVWSDTCTCMPLKCRPDIVTEDGWLADVKTADAVDPEAWTLQVHRFAYHRAAALYLQGAALAYEVELKWRFVAVSKEPPHEVAVYELEPMALQLGHAQNVATLRDIAQCQTTGRWDSRLAGRIHSIGLPAWAYKQQLHAPLATVGDGADTAGELPQIDVLHR